MAASQNAKTLAYRSISRAAVFLFSYNLSFNPRTMFCVKGKKSFSAIAKKNRTTFGRNFTLRNTSSYLTGVPCCYNARPRPILFKRSLNNPCEGPPDFFFFFFFTFPYSSAMIQSLRLLQCCLTIVAYCTKCQFFFSRNEMQIA